MRTPIDLILRDRGYCPRRSVARYLTDHLVCEGETRVTAADTLVDPALLSIDSEPIDPGSPMLIGLHKPCGYVCSTVPDGGPTVFELLPERFARRTPPLRCVGRLDKDSSGLLLLTDDGQLLHRLTSPKHQIIKEYRVTLARPLIGTEAAILAAGTLVLRNESSPILPATLIQESPTQALIAVTEGRYHLVRRIFAALGNHVETLTRLRIGPITIDSLPEGSFRHLELSAISP